jgi:hypothetical protein
LHGHRHAHVCAAPKPHYASCHAIIDLDVPGNATPSTVTPNSVTPLLTPQGYAPADLQKAYNLPSGTAGAGATVAVVDAYDLPTAQADVNTYRTQFGLPICSTGCFTKVNQNGGSTPPASNASWGQEIALDLEMVSAACPNCNILLVEANSASLTDLGIAVNTAVSMGAVAVSNSYGGSESASNANYDATYFNHPGVAITASSGDSGYGAQYPAASPYVTAVGGTTLTSSVGGGFSEKAWASAGSGCSAYSAKPSWQHDSGCARRTIADVAAVADPATGVAVYDSTPYGGQSGWLVFGGTSVASPIVAGTYALAGTPAAGSIPASFAYAAPQGALTDVTSGTNGSCGSSYLCTAGPGYDGPTGLGTPNGIAAFTASTATPTPAPTPAPTPTPTPTPAPAPAPQLLGNAGFETGSAAPWSSTSGVVDSSTVQPAHTGSWKAWLDGYGARHTDTLSQTVTIPSTATKATLSYWLHVDTAETTRTTANDKLNVQLVSSSGTVLATLGSVSNLNKGSGYTLYSTDISAYRGKTLIVRFTGTENGSMQTSFVVDDTALTTQ